MKFFSIFFYLWIPCLLACIFGYFYFGGLDNFFEYFKNILIQYKIYEANVDDFTANFHFYLFLFFSVFFTFWWGLMAGKIKFAYMPLIMASIFAGVWYHVETIRVSYYITAGIIFWIFVFMSFTIPSFWNQIGIIKKISDKRKNNFKNTAIQTSGQFVQIVTDYSLKINNRPAQRAVYKTTHPHTGEEFLAESSRSFDPLFPTNSPKQVEIYFDRHNPKKYLIDLWE